MNHTLEKINKILDSATSFIQLGCKVQCVGYIPSKSVCLELSRVVNSR